MKQPLKEKYAVRASEVLLVAVIRSPLKLTYSQRGDSRPGQPLQIQGQECGLTAEQRGQGSEQHWGASLRVLSFCSSHMS